MPLRPGLTGTASMVVTEADTAVALRSGDVAVLATPRVVCLAEEATVQAVAGELDDDSTTVGYRVQLDHLAPTAVGGRVDAEATLENVESRRLTFRVSVSDGRGLVAAGRITRVVVERDRFLEKAAGADQPTDAKAKPGVGGDRG
jgi:predicted thioesterase